MRNHGRVVQNQGLTEFGKRLSLEASGIDFLMILGSLLGRLGGLWTVSGPSGLNVYFQESFEMAIGTPGILVTLKV